MKVLAGVRNLRSSFALSVVAHILLILVCLFLIPKRAADLSKKVTWIEIVPEKKSVKDPQTQHHIVQTERGEKVDKAAPDAFLGEQTQIVDRQSVSKEHRIEIGREAKPTHQAQVKEAARPGGGKLTARSTDLSKLGMALLPTAKEAEQMRPKGPESDTPQWASPGGGPMDYIQGVRESERTALNTREYIFFGYYQRIRERLDRAWVPILQEKLTLFHRSGRHLASEMDHTTKVMVVMNPLGEIVQVQVVSESGTQDLDDAAIKAFNSAGPFPNPPHGIVDPDGRIKIPWEFILRT